ncbi:MAG: hypothetical protein HWE26_00880 [Alteromonadaceae bacterium]|nr:hypothetical protein [Alteromonadaceae bacterium]
MLIQSLFSTSDLLQRSKAGNHTYSDETTSMAQPPQSGFAIGEGSHIIDKLSAPSTLNMAERYKDNPPLKTQLMSVEEIKTYWQSYGQSRDVTAIAYIDGEPAIMFGKHTTSRNQFSDIANAFNGNPEQAINALKSEYGNRLSVEYFKPGQGPTNAEAFEQFNGRSFDEYVASQVRNAMSAQVAREQQLMEYQQRQIAWNNTPVNAIFKINDTIIASSANDTTSLHTNNLLKALEELGMNSEDAQSLYRNTLGKAVSAQSLEQQLGSIFGSGLSSDYPGENARPTRKEVSTKAQAQYWQGTGQYG